VLQELLALRRPGEAHEHGGHGVTWEKDTTSPRLLGRAEAGCMDPAGSSW
jgi:hypothetical protein